MHRIRMENNTRRVYSIQT